MKLINKLLAAVLVLAVMLTGKPAAALDEISVAYFSDWPMPFQFAKENGTYDRELGVKVNWVLFDTGTAMSAAMASGDIQISVSQGAPPFVVATSAGQDLQIVDVAVSYSDNDNCVVATRHEIDKNNAKEVEGKTVGLPKGTAAHYGFLAQMRYFGVDISTMEIVDMAPQEGAAAFEQGNLDMVCGFGGALDLMKQHGNVLLTGAEKEEVGILVFDVTSTPTSFAVENSDLLAKFLKVTADANTLWQQKGNQDAMMKVIAKDSGLTEEAAWSQISTFAFPTIEEQLSNKWLGGAVQQFLLGVANIFEEAGSIPQAPSTYNNNVDSSYLEAASKL